MTSAKVIAKRGIKAPTPVFAWNFGNKIVGPINGILFMNLVPVTSFVITVIGGYHISAFELVGCLLVIIALIANNLYNRYKSNKKQQVEAD